MNQNGDCSGEAIGSHSIQNSAIIEPLSRDGHVYILKASLGDKILKLKYEGRNRASTFSGFCAFHDNQIFREIDFVSGNIPDSFEDRQKVLFFLRAISLEGWKKQNIVNSIGQIATALEENDYQKISELLSLPTGSAEDIIKNPDAIIWSLRGHAKGLEDVEGVEGSINWQLRNKKYHMTTTHHFKLNLHSAVAIASGISPLWDLEGVSLYGGPMPGIEQRMAHMSFTLFAKNNETHILFSFLKKDKSIFEPLMVQFDGLLNNQQVLAKKITEFSLENCENIVFSPAFIDSLTPEQKEELESAASWTLMDSSKPHSNLSFTFFS